MTVPSLHYCNMLVNLALSALMSSQLVHANGTVLTISSFCWL